MSASIESMFYVRETPWHGLGTRVITAPTSKEAGSSRAELESCSGTGIYRSE